MANILVVDDEQMLCDLLQKVLVRYGHSVSTTTSGAKALELFGMLRPHITLLDLVMPDMDGLAVLKRIRVLDPSASIVMLTGGGTNELEHQAREFGVTDFLRKGQSLDVLLKRLDQALPSQAAPAPAAPAAAQDLPASGPPVLVVDDEPAIRDLIVKFLSK